VFTLIFITVDTFIYTVSDTIDKLVSLDKDTATFKLDVILGGLESL